MLKNLCLLQNGQHVQFPQLHEMLILVCVNTTVFSISHRTVCAIFAISQGYLIFKSACFVNTYYKGIAPLKFLSHSL